MSKLNDLIKRLCPSGVPFLSTKSLSIDSFWLMPSTPNYLQEGIPYITSKNVKNGLISFDDVAYVSEEDYLSMSKNRSIKKGDLLITMIGTIGEAAFVGDFTKFYGQNLYLVRLDINKINPKFFYHFFTSQKDNLVSRKNPSSQGYIKAGSVEELKVPVPPMDVQNEIVRILDSFEELASELSLELAARKKQYEYYRDGLFESIDSKFLVKLGSLASIIRGGNFQKKDFVETGYPCIHYGQMYTHFGIFTYDVLKYLPKTVYDISKKANKNDIVMAVTSENVEDVCKCVAWLGEEDIAVSGHAAIIKHNINAKYLSYFFHSNMFFKQKVKLAHGTKVIEVTPDRLLDILVPVPSMEEQENAVKILDSFNSLISDTSKGIPSEIDGRTKQYEYYRDRLLAFKELKA